MSKDATRLALCAGAAIALILASVFGMDWFRARFAMQAMSGSLSIDLRELHACDANGMCGSISLSMMPGMYPTTAGIAFWTSLGFCAAVAGLAARRIMGGVTSPNLARIGYLLGLAAFACAVMAAFVFQPEGGMAQMVSVTVVRTWSPAMMLGGLALGIVALFLAGSETFDTGRDVQPAPASPRPAPLPEAVAQPAPARRAMPDSLPLDGPAPERSEPAPPPRAKRATGTPDGLQGRLAYATATAELSAQGIDAFREDGVSRLVLWRDVVGVVARRLPPLPPYRGATFVDVVSVPDATLRFLPWTKLRGAAMPEDPVDRARAIVRLALQCNPDVKLDRATRAFLDGEQAGQLTDDSMLQAHDQRLA